jgi:hypothetical protein
VADSGSTASAGSPNGRLVGHDLAALVEASRPLAAELVTRADLGKFSRLATGSGC